MDIYYRDTNFNYKTPNIKIPTKIHNKGVLYSESMKDNFPGNNSPDSYLLNNYLKYKLYKKNLTLDDVNYDTYKKV